jgi:endo-1,3-1,4-beta-glycanase ExoK
MREMKMKYHPFNSVLLFSAISLSVLGLTSIAHAVSSAELYTSKSYLYGRFSARIQFAAGDGVVSSFFLWKDGSEKSGTFWNELDFEKLGADCHLETNAYFGSPAATHVHKPTLNGDLCGGFHTYTYEWTPEYIAWFVDDTEIRREIGATATAYSTNATAGMQIRFNIWPGDASFGGNFSPSILPVYEFINWIEYSSYADGAFELEWREDFDASSLPSGWVTGNWGSPKNLSTHSPANVVFVNGYAVLALTADNATGSPGTPPADNASAGALTTGGTSSATGGTANLGGATTDQGGAVTGGSTNTGGTVASGGSLPATGGSGLGTGGSSISTSPSTGGAPVAVGVGASTSLSGGTQGTVMSNSATDPGGCGCRVVGPGSNGLVPTALSLLGLLLTRRRQFCRTVEASTRRN